MADVKIHDFANDQRGDQRDATQADIDELQQAVQKLGKVRGDLTILMAACFPTFAEDIKLASALRGRLNRDFHRANKRHPDKEEFTALLEAFQNAWMG